MPRIARLLNSGEPTCYHVMSRTALNGFPFSDVDNDELLRIIKHFSSVYFTEIIGFCLLGNHFHALLKMFPGDRFSDDEVKKRYVKCYGNSDEFSPEDIPFFREKWSSLSQLMKDIKVTFSRYYNKMYNRRGTLWGERFKSLIVEDGETLINCLAYIDLNPIRAGIVEHPEDYRWSSIGYHLQTGNRDGFLSLDFGLKEFGGLNATERLHEYRRYLYEAGAIARSDGKSTVTIDAKIVEKERKHDFQITRRQRFRCRTRYFSDSGIIGTKAYVSRLYDQFKDHFQSKHPKKPKSIKGLEGVYSLKRLSEA